MRPCMTCIYWTLLLISVVSSGLLFLIVASENAQIRSRTDNPESSDGDYDNATLNPASENIVEPSGVVIPETQPPPGIKTNYKEDYDEEGGTTVSPGFEKGNNDEVEEERDLDILGESLIQQPNLSQGISETGQAVVLTLVDTAAAELQNLAEPKISPEFRARSSTKNTTVHASDAASDAARESEDLANVPASTQIPSPPIVDTTTERPNDTESLEDDEVLVVQKSIVEEVPEVVVVVRAEQKVGTDAPTDFRIEEDVETYQEDVPKVEDVFTPAAELNDSAARAQLVGGTRDDAAAVVLDGIVTAGPTDPHEDIPSFSEWAQKRLEEAEKKKTHPNASVQNPGGPGRGVSGMKVRSKNYASPDCGAKVVASNPEAQSARSVLVSTRDEYMLNTCTSRIWFVVELCEAIQAKKIELANFELFSSSPKDFSVFVSDRFPTKEWSAVGQFTAKDMKDMQSFTLHPHLFGKFIKVETHTHYGSEHYCPISLFRAYGTSEFEVLETETENQILRETTPDLGDDDDDEEEPLDGEGGQPSRNLFGSARDAVLSIVKKAAEVLVKSSDLTGNNITEIQQSIDKGSILENSYTSCTTPRYTILCGNCSDQKFAKVFQLVSCRDRQLDQLLKIDFVNETLAGSRLCSIHGVEIEAFSRKDEDCGDEIDRTDFEPVKNLQATFLSSVFKSEYIVALCNVLATKERKVVMNTSNEVVSNNVEEVKEDMLTTSKTSDHTGEQTVPHHQITATCTVDPSSPGCRTTTPGESKRRSQETTNEELENLTTIESSSSMETLAAQIKPTKTLSKEDMKRESSVPTLETSKEPTEETLQAEVITTISPSTNIPTPTLKIQEEQPVLGTIVETSPQTVTSIPVVTIDVQDPLSDSAGQDTEVLESVPAKIEREQIDEVKQGKVDFGEPEAKIPASQDSIAFDALLSDFKDFEGDVLHLQNGAGAGSSSSSQPPLSSTPQKESVFLRLSNRIKALERNMSLSGQYLEELSRRYKKQVEEMQRSLERAVTAMGEESRKGEERELKRLEEIATLREEIAVLSKSVESLFYERDNWRSRLSVAGQHALFIILEVVIVSFILSYCRKSADFNAARQSTAKKVLRRKSAENFGATKKTKKRRPSEIASHITGTYHELMIEDRSHESKRERKKKRKKEFMTSHKPVGAYREALLYKTLLNIDDTTLPSRRASSIDPPHSCEPQIENLYKRPESKSDTDVTWFSDLQRRERVMKSSTEDIASNSERDVDPTESVQESTDSSLVTQTGTRTVRSTCTELGVELVKPGPSKGGILKTARLSSPSFMKTALGARKKRKLSSNEEKWDLCQESGHSNEASPHPSPIAIKVIPPTVGSVNGSATNGINDESDSSRSSSATPVSGKKEKRSTGLKKMGHR